MCFYKSKGEKPVSQPHDQSKPTFLILGATGGIGTALCHRLASRGARLVLGARGEERLRSLADELDATWSSVDATNFKQVSECVEDALEAHGRLDGVVNLVGSVLLKPAHLTTEEEWREVLRVNLDSAFAVIRSAGRVMRKEGGSVVLASSAAARIGIANHDAIAAAKAGIIGLTLSASATYAKANVRVNCVAPGLVQTPLTQKLTERESARKTSEQMHPLGRLGEPEHVASAIDWLLQSDQSWISGQVLGVDGGLGTVLSSQR